MFIMLEFPIKSSINMCRSNIFWMLDEESLELLKGQYLSLNATTIKIDLLDLTMLNKEVLWGIWINRSNKVYVLVYEIVKHKKLKLRSQ